MIKKKNQVSVLIEDCRNCPNATLKFIKEAEEDYMFCQTSTSCIQLREHWENCPIPDWCPRLNHKMSPLCGLHAKALGGFQ